MPPKCNIYFQKGIEAGLLEGKMTSQNMAACNIYRIQKGIKAPGLGKGGKRSTRKASRKNRKDSRKASRRNRKQGGVMRCQNWKERGYKSMAECLDSQTNFY